MAAELTAQEIRGMERYATAAPSEEWGEAFKSKLRRWRADLAAYELAESSQPPARPAAASGDGGDATLNPAVLPPAEADE